jgi:hypothetical protein
MKTRVLEIDVRGFDHEGTRTSLPDSMPAGRLRLMMDLVRIQKIGRAHV